MSKNYPSQNKAKFSIHAASTQKQAELLQHVRHLYDQGFNLIPLQAGEKKALNSWKNYQDRRQTWQELARMNWQGGIAGINGVSGLRSFDFDHLDLFGPVRKLLEMLGLPLTYEWTPLSGNGYHMWVRCEEEVILGDMPKTRYVGRPIDPEKYPFKQLELRLSGCYTVLPPSVHPSGKSYEWKYKDALPKGEIAVVTAKQLAAVFFALATFQPERAATRTVTSVSYSIPSTLQAKPHAFTREEQVSAQVDTFGESFAARRAQGIASTMDEYVRSNVVRQQDQVQALPKYAARILQNELVRMRNAPEGERNNQLNKTAYALGGWIAGGLFDKRLVKEELIRVAEGIGLEQPEIQATIRSGVEAGMQHPRKASLSEVEDVEDKEIRSSAYARLLGFSADDVGNARSVQALYGTHILYTDEYGWLHWKGTHWVRDIAAVMRKIIKTLEMRRLAARNAEKEVIVKATVGDMKRITGAMSALMPYCTVKISEFDNDPDLLNTLDGVVNLRTGEMEPHHPAQRFTCCVPVGVGNEEDAKPWVAFLLDALGSKEMVDYLQMAVGYSLTGHTREEILFYLYGPSRSGKGTFTELLLALLLHPLAEEVDFNTFTAKRDGNDQNFDLAALKPARLVIASESNRNQSLNPAKIKQLTGGNRVQAAFKHRDMFSYKPQYKIWLVSNHPLNGDVDDDALWGRVHIINFPHSHLHCEDVGLKERLKSPEVLRGVLYWAIQGAMKWYQAGRLPVPEQIKQSVSEHRAQLDTVQMWLDDKAELVEGAWTPNSIVVSSYTAWCAENNYEPKRGKALTASLKYKGCVPGEKQYWNGVQTRGVLGLRIL